MSNAVDILTSAHQRAAAVRPDVGGFPYLAEVLRQAGVSRYHYSVPAATSLYLTDAGPVVTQADPIVSGMAAVSSWDPEALIEALRTDQAGQSTFTQFAQSCWAAGVVDFDVDLDGRTCTYKGATGERYVEAYDRVDLPDQIAREAQR